MLRKKFIISVFIAGCLILTLSACEYNESQDQSNLHDTRSYSAQEEQTVPDTTVYGSEIDVEYQSYREIIERIHHIVEENETLEDITRTHNTTIEILKQINWFLDDDELRVGQQLRIPPTGFPLHRDIEINISEVSNEQVDYLDADIIFDFDSTGLNVLIEIDPNIQDIKIFFQGLSTGPRQPYVTPVIGYFQPDSVSGQILLLNYDNISTRNVGIKFTDDDGMVRYFVIDSLDQWIIYDFTVEFWNLQD